PCFKPLTKGVLVANRNILVKCHLFNLVNSPPVKEVIEDFSANVGLAFHKGSVPIIFQSVKFIFPQCAESARRASAISRPSFRSRDPDDKCGSPASRLSPPAPRLPAPRSRANRSPSPARHSTACRPSRSTS